jgi:manganese-dependent inorganic pyrophosphatase
MKRANMFNNEEYTEKKDEGEFHVARKKNVIETEFEKHHDQAHEVVTHLPPVTLPTVQAYIPQTLGGAIFCGHLVTDMDSIAGAIGAAELYGGVPARASEINSETAFALEEWGVEKPRPIEELLMELPTAGVCLVDHQQTSQLNKSIDVSAFNLFLVFAVCN